MKLNVILSLSLVCLKTIPGFAQLPSNGLIAHYKFNFDPGNDKSTVYDFTHNKNNGTMVDGVSYTADRFGVGCSALLFDGTGYVTVPSSNSLKKPRNEFTAAVWFKLSKGADFFRQWITICCKSDLQEETAESPQYRMQATAQTVSINTEFTENFTPQLSYEVWYFYAYTFDGSKVHVFLNGKFVFEYDYAGQLAPNNLPLEIGRDLPGGLEYYFGAMDDLRLYDRSLDETELLQLYQDNSEASDPDRCNTAPVKPNPVVNQSPPPDPTPQISTPPPVPPVATTTPPDPAPPPVVTQTPTQIDVKDLPKQIGGTSVDYQKQIVVKKGEVTIYPYDNEKEDGDIVSINVNGVWVRDKYELKNKKPKPPERVLIKCSLNPGGNNYIISKAWNVGTISPNTLTVEIDDGVSVQKVLINSDVGLSGGIRIISEQ